MQIGAARSGGTGTFPCRFVGASVERITLPYTEYDVVDCACANKPMSAGMRRVRCLLIHEPLQQAAVEGQMAVLQLDPTHLDQSVEM